MVKSKAITITKPKNRGAINGLLGMSFCLMLTACTSEPEQPIESPSTIPSADSELLLHVPSPEWQDQVIYFLMTDRFNDGDPTNNDQGLGEFDPAKSSHFSGGDLQGVIDQLDYIQNMGMTAVWTTPWVANQWLSLIHI